MSETDSDAESYDSKTAFIEAVKKGGAELDGVTYYTEGKGSGTTYHARNAEGDEEQVTKAEVEAGWDAVHGDAGEPEEDEPEPTHIATLYYSQSNWVEDEDLETLEEILDDAGWSIEGEVASGGYRIFDER